MTSTPTIWPGTDEERVLITEAAKNNCECAYDHDGCFQMCRVHLALANDQRLVNHLVFARRASSKFTFAEHDPQADPKIPSEDIPLWLKIYWRT